MNAFYNNLNNSDCVVEEDIFNKTFDRTLRVSPPLATDLKQYLSSVITEALEEDLAPDVLDRLFRLLQRKIQEDSLLATPRVVVSYVNEIGSLYAQWKTGIPIETMALYVLHRDKVEKDPFFLEKSSCISERFLHVANDSEWRKNLAALIFNVEPEDANEVLLTGPVNGALVRGDSSEIKELSEVKGFDEILANVVHENSKSWAEEGDLLLSRVANNLNDLNLSKSLELDVWPQLEKTLGTVQFGSLDRLEKLQGLLVIVKRSESPVKASLAIFLALRRFITGKEKVNQHQGMLWCEFVSSVIKTACKHAQLMLDDFPLGNVEIPRGEGFAVGVAISCERGGYFDFDKFKISQSTSAIHEDLSRLIEEDASAYLEGYRQLHHCILNESKVNEDYKKLINRLKSEDVEDLTAVIEAVRQLADDYKDFEALDDYFSNGKVYVHVEELIGLESEASAASLIWILIRKNSAPKFEMALHQNVQNEMPKAKSGWDLTSKIFEGRCSEFIVKRLAELARGNEFFATIAGYAIKNGSNLYRMMLKEMISVSGVGRVKSLFLVYNYKNIVNICGGDVGEELMKNIDERFDERLDIDFSKVSDLFVMDAYSQDGKSNLRKIYKRITQHLKGLNLEGVSETLYEEDSDLELLIAVKKVDSSFKLSAAVYKPAIVDHACNVIKGEVSLPSRAEEWEYVVSCINPRSYKIIGKDIVDRLESSYVDNGGVENFVALYSLITYEMPFEDSPDISLNRFYANLSSSNQDGLDQFAKKHLHKIEKCLDSCEEGTREYFIETMKKYDNSFCVEVRKGLKIDGESED